MRQAQVNNDLKINNTLRILREIRQDGPISRRDIQKSTNLSWGTVSAITTTLINADILTETDTVETSLGRRPSEVDINNNDNLIAGIDLNISALTVVITDLKGKLVVKKTSLIVQTDKESVIRGLFFLTDDVFNEVKGKKILSIGIASQGVVDIENGISVYSPHFTNWNNVEICKMFEERYDIPSFIFHDPECVLYSEKFFSNSYDKAYSTSSALIRLDKGVGMSVFTGVGIHHSLGQKAAELGHITMDINGPLCNCGKQGCLETYVSTKEIANRYLEKVNKNNAITEIFNDPDSITYLSLYDSARNGDTLSIEVYNELGFYLGLAIAHVINLFCPDEIILYGTIADIHDIYKKKMNDTITENVFPIYKSQWEIRYTTILGKDAAAIGGALSAFESYIDKNKNFINGNHEVSVKK